MSAETLEQIAKEIAACTKCSLCKTRTNTVPGEGNPDARLLFIGEAPGYHEDIQGRPFVGNAGQLLDKMFRAIKTERQDVFIANVVKCRPPNNRDPLQEEIDACKPYLDRQIAAIDPRVIITLGRFSMARWWPGARISQIHGQAKTENGRMLIPMYHPAAALRDQTGYTMQKFKEDALTIPALLEKAAELARNELWSFAQPDPEPELPAPKPAKKPAQVAEPPVTYSPVQPEETKPKVEIAPETVKATAPETLEVVAETTAPEPEKESEPKPATRAPRSRKKKDEPNPIGEQLTLF